MMDNDYALTTVDNPFSPFTQFDEWFAYDQRLGYNTCGLLARIAMTSDELSETDHHQAIQDAIDEIVQANLSGRFRKVSRTDFVSST